MTVGLLTLELHIPHAQSLKDKRVVLRSVKDRLKKFNIAVAEVDHQDLWQRATLGVVTIGESTEAVDRALAAVADEVERLEPGVITATHMEFLT